MMASTSTSSVSVSSVEEVCQYLQTRNVKHDVIHNFRENKMDKDACWRASEENLKELGLVLRGDLISLKGFCAVPTQDLQVSQVSQLVTQAAKERTTNRLEFKTVHTSWFHFDSQQHKYINVRQQKGGGSKKIKFPNNTNGETILNKMKEIYIPNGVSKYFGSQDELKMELGSSKKVIDMENFVLKDYISENHLPKTYLHFLTRPKTESRQMVDDFFREPYPIIPDENGFDGHLMTSTPTNTSPLMIDEPSTSSSGMGGQQSYLGNIEHEQLALHYQNAFENHRGIQLPSSLGQPINAVLFDQSTLQDQSTSANQQSSASYFALNEQRDITTLATDALMSQEDPDPFNVQNNQNLPHPAEQPNETDEDALESLRQTRKSRVPPEPELEDDHVVVSIRHPLLSQRVSRMFANGLTNVTLYDWAGSLSKYPAHYKLYDARRNQVDPTEIMLSGTYNMREVDDPIPMTPNGTIAFQGFKAKENPITHRLICETINEARETALKNLRQDTAKGEVERCDVFKTLLSFYQESNALEFRNVALTFKKEIASGEGVTKEAYSLFFEEVYKRWDGFGELVPHYGEDCIDWIGKIIQHAFLLFEMFPIRISYAALKYHLFKTIDDDEVLNSFLKFLPERESRMLETFDPSVHPTQACLNILSEFNIFVQPNKDNIKNLCIKAAYVCLLQMPCFNLQNLVANLPFFQGLGELSFQQIYVQSIPTAEALIENILSDENSNHEGRIVTWVHRYIRACNLKSLLNFIRFITAMPSMPKQKIRIIFTDQSKDNLRPRSETCFGIFRIPRQFSSFSELSKTFDLYIQQEPSGLQQASLWEMDD